MDCVTMEAVSDVVLIAERGMDYDLAASVHP